MTKNKNQNYSRKDFESYLSSVDEREKYAFEKRTVEDDFANDALDGWSESGTQLHVMKKLDRKFKINPYKWMWIFSSVLVVIGVAIFFVMNRPVENGNEKTLTSKDQTKLTIEKTDIVIPEKIEAMQELPKKEQIKVKTIIADFNEIKNEEPSKKENTPIDDLPVKPNEESKLDVKIIKEEINGKEIYLFDLKLLDYRAYRSKPTIETKQLVLSGTPANFDNKESVSDEAEWKTIDIPYIEYLSKTMEFFSKGQNKKALTRFQVILESYTDDINANFYAGLCYYNLKQYQEAITSFEKCTNSSYSNFKEEAEWYLAKSLLAKGEKSKANSILNEIILNNGYYSNQAKKILSSQTN